MFLAPTKESALEWCRDINILHWRNERLEVPFFLYFVEISEQPIWFDSNILVGFYFPDTNKDSISKAYWDSGIIDVEPNTTRALEYMTSKETVIIGKTKWKIKTDGPVGVCPYAAGRRRRAGLWSVCRRHAKNFIISLGIKRQIRLISAKSLAIIILI